ncbi:voltage-gated chloride channel [hot springs metagenome]|uniref:Voltage-gated chloride channel n=1 Tax=hot springs metagenome TaxID=433727 RepID=A0A5J4KYK1_9ZZZZ
MRKKVLESSILFVSIVKWLFLAACVGILVGISTAIFLKALDAGIIFAKGLHYYYFLLPVALLISTLMVRYLAPQAEGHGTEKVIEAVHRYSGRINPLVVPVKLIATIITISMGGSAGKEGPAAQIGAGLCSAFSDLFKFDDKDRKKLVICGISAGFATVFGTPIAGAIFGVEVLFVGAMLYDVLLPSFVAGIVGYQVSSTLGITYFHEPLRFVPVFSSALFIKVCISGLFFGLCSLIFVEMLRFFENTGRRMRLNKIYKPLIGGSVLVVLAIVFSTDYLGLGLQTIKNALEGDKVYAGSFLLKMIFTSITLSFGGSGGIITPIFFIGATAGNTFGSLLGLDASLFAAIGMVGLLAGAANTPISASIMAVELFGPQVAPYAAVACVISFLMTGHRSVYPSQVLSMQKSASLTVQKGKEMRDIEGVEFKPRPKSISGGISRLKRFKRK